MKDSFDSRVFSYLSRHEYLNWMSDAFFLKARYRIVTHRKLNLENPESFNEKIQWLKLYDHNGEYVKMVDKCDVKPYVASIIGAEYIIPNVGGPWNRFDEINWGDLPERFVLKCTHNSGTGVAVITDKTKIDQKKLGKQFEQNLKSNFFYAEREWPYKLVKPRIIAEQFISDDSEGQLKDYKVHVFDGKAQIIQVDFDRFKGHKRNLYDRNWNYIPAEIEYPTHPEILIEKPHKLEKLIKLAEKLSAGIPYVRVDFYIVGEQIYFGEMTFYHGGGLERIVPEELNRQMGEWIVLPKIGKD